MTHELTHDRLEYWRRAAQTAHDDRPGTVLYIPAGELLALVDLAQRVSELTAMGFLQGPAAVTMDGETITWGELMGRDV